jgi:L-lysine 6-transaminase
MSIATNSKFNIKIDFDKSHDSFLYDKRTDREYLDFFGMYASLPLGYNHEIFQTDEFKKEFMSVSSFKVNNCEFVSDETLEFDEMFTEYAGQGNYKYFHYCCTGALAVEAAIKTCLRYKNFHTPRVLSFNNSFHGINSFGNFVTSRFEAVESKLVGIPSVYSCKVDLDLEQVEFQLAGGQVTCILVEPIQCSVGDVHIDKDFMNGLKELSDKYNVPLVFDEIQVGFGGTGKVWYHEHLDYEPDIIIFGKKTQLSGIMVNEQHSQTFKEGEITRLDVTWNADVTDMIRCKYIMKAYQKYNILDNVSKMGDYLTQSLSTDEKLSNVRNSGLIIAFDLPDTEKRNNFVNNLFLDGVLCNPTGKRSIRIRPNLSLTMQEAEMAIEKIRGNKC